MESLNVHGLDGLTRTERRIIAAFLSESPPPKAKEVARQLGVSVRTVYKALYKYRKLCRERGVEPPIPYLRGGSRRSGVEAIVEDVVRGLLPQLREVVAEEVRRWLVNTVSCPPGTDGSQPEVETLLVALRDLQRSIEKLNNSINRLIDSLPRTSENLSTSNCVGEELPSFIVENPWITRIAQLGSRDGGG
ncbi:MAG: hypothetical protein DRJ43_00260 [Thermoprotei archaeon]|nr:MAG: hypothetical protein DRJ43_00260 [Thermoprotei archaeon]